MSDIQKDIFALSTAGHVVGVRTLHPYVRTFADGYIVPDDTLAETWFDIEQADINVEREQEIELSGTCVYKDEYLETLAVLRKIAIWGPTHDFFLMHGVVIEYDGRGYMFTAPSGTGKSTHVRLWYEMLGSRMRVINGDKTFLRFDDSGAVIAYGSPWAGKEGWQKNASVELVGVVLLSQGSENVLHTMPIQQAFDVVMQQGYLPQAADARIAALDLYAKLIEQVPFYSLSCDISQEAARASFEGLTRKCQTLSQEER